MPKKIEEGGQGEGHADEASFPSRDEGEQTKVMRYHKGLKELSLKK